MNQKQEKGLLSRANLSDWFPSIESPTMTNFFENWQKNLTNLPPFRHSIYEDKKGNLVIEVALPGLSTEDIQVTLEKGRLWIKGSKQETQEDKENQYYCKADESYSYSFALPADIDENKQPEATLKNGVMKIAFTKSSKEQPKKITIKNA